MSGLDLEAGVAEFGLAIKQDGTEIYTGDPKGKLHTRVVLDPETVEVLREHRDRCTALAAAAGIALDPEGYVFSDALDHRTPWRPATVTQRFGRLRDALGLKTSLHKTRHYSATELIIAGVDVATVAGRLGHASASTTLNFYTAWVSEADQRAAKMLAPRLPERPTSATRADWAKIIPEHQYEVIAAGLREAIAAGEYQPGDPIPTEKQLAAEHAVSAGTAHRVMELLRTWGLVTASRGRRTTVVSSDELAIALSGTGSSKGMADDTLATEALTADDAVVDLVTPSTLAPSELLAADVDVVYRGRVIRQYRTEVVPSDTDELFDMLVDAIHRTGGDLADAGDYELVIRGADSDEVVTTFIAPRRRVKALSAGTGLHLVGRGA